MKNFLVLFNRQMIDYAAVGFFTAIIYFSLFYILVYFSGLNYFIGMSCSYIIAVSFHFLASRRFTFSTSKNSLGVQTVRYLGLLLLNFIISLILLSVFVEILEQNKYISIIFSSSITLILGYFISKFWVFSSGISKNNE